MFNSFKEKHSETEGFEVSEKVKVPTGLFEKVTWGLHSGEERTVVKEKGVATLGMYWNVSYEPHRVELDLVDAVQKLYDYLDIKVEYTPEQEAVEEKIGDIIKPEPVKPVRKKRASKKKTTRRKA